MKMLIIFEKGERAYYNPISSFCRKKGIPFEFVEYTWERKTQNHAIEEVLGKIDKIDEAALLGFSIGGFIALSAAARTKAKIKGLILGSPTPLFSNTVYPNNIKKYLGKRRLLEALKTSISALGKDINCPTAILVGGEEDDEVFRQCKSLSVKIKKSVFVEIQNTGHDMQAKEYVAAIQKCLLKTLGRM